MDMSVVSIASTKATRVEDVSSKNVLKKSETEWLLAF